LRKHVKNRIALIGFIILLIIIIAAYYYRSPLKLVDVPLTSLKEELDVTTLDNGMLVTIREMHNLPLVTIQFWVHTGGRNEPEAYKGIAHVFEHIWFKGTPTQPVGSFHKKVESLGGELNAMTSYDWTMYYVTVPSDKFDAIFPYMVDLLFNSNFDPAEIDKELQVIVEEQRSSFNEPERYIDDQFGLLLIDKHPYKHPVIGYKDTILANTPETIKQFYNTWYVPNNMNIVVVGNIDKKNTLQKIQAAFADFKPKELPQLNLPKEEPNAQERYNSTFRDIGFTYVAVGYKGPSAQDDDQYTMMVLNTIFSVGESSRLQNIVKKQKNLITKGYSVFVPLNDLGVFETVLVVEPEKAGAAKAEIILQLNRFKTEYVTDEELQRAKMNIRADKVRSQEEIFQVGYDIGRAWIDGNLDDYPKFLDKINAVTKEDIRKAAQEYFTAYTMYEVKPKL
jgi:zinc protease